MDQKKVVDFLGIRLNNLTAEEILDHVDQCIAQRKICQIVGVNVDQALRVIENPVSKKIFEDAEIVFTDGKPIIWMAKWLKRPIVEKISGPDLMELLCERAAKKGYRIFLLGAGPGVAANAAKNLEQRYPGFQCVGTYSPPMGFEKDPKEMEKIISMLKESQADQLFVGMGSPKQDIFIYENMQKYQIPVSYSMGAALDFIGGSVKRAPKWMCDHGLEWLHLFQKRSDLIRSGSKCTLLLETKPLSLRFGAASSSSRGAKSRKPFSKTWSMIFSAAQLCCGALLFWVHFLF